MQTRVKLVVAEAWPRTYVRTWTRSNAAKLAAIEAKNLLTREGGSGGTDDCVFGFCGRPLIFFFRAFSTAQTNEDY